MNFNVPMGNFSILISPRPLQAPFWNIFFPIVLLIFILLPNSAPAQGNLCDKGLKPIDDGRGYIMRRGTPRCEGIYQSKINSNNLQIVSYLIGKLRYDLKTQDSLKIEIPTVPDLSARPVRVRGLSLPLNSYYRLDSVLPAEGFMIWPIKEVLAPARLSSSMIGLFAWYGSGDEKTFVPLRVSPVEGDAEGATESAAVLTIRSPVKIESLKWRVYSKGEKPPPRKDYPFIPIPEGGLAKLKLPPGEAETLIMDIAAKIPNNDDWLKRNKIRFFRPGK